MDSIFRAKQTLLKRRKFTKISQAVTQAESYLHGSLLEFGKSCEDWQENKKGIRLSDKTEDCLTNLRFADDVLLFSTTLGKLREMLCDFKTSTEGVGLGIHPDKTKYSATRTR